MPEDCPSLDCCPRPLWDYSLNAYPVVTNEEITIFVPCPEGMTCESGGISVTIPAGTIRIRKTTEDDDPDDLIEEIAQQIAENQAYPQMLPRTTIYSNQEVVVQCGDGQMGDSGAPFFSAPGVVTIPSGSITSLVSVADATAKATTLANNLLSTYGNCHWENTEQTVECPEGQTGGPFTVPAGSYESTISQADADQKALDAAQAMADAGCSGGSGTPCDLSEADGTVMATVTASQVQTTHHDTFGLSFPVGEYTAHYVNGAYTQRGENINPATNKKVWSTNRFAFYSNGSLKQSAPDINPSVEYEYIGGVLQPGGGATQATQEADRAGFISTAWFHTNGHYLFPDNSASLHFTRINQVEPLYQSGSVTNSDGVPNPTFSLVRERKFIQAQPARVRIASFDANLFDLTTCPNCPAPAAQPVWDGTFPRNEVASFTSVNWSATANHLQLNGRVVFAMTCGFRTSGLPSDSGCGWVIELTCSDGGFVNVGYWIKTSGLNPVGTYTLADHPVDGPSCGTMPGTLTLEEY